MSPSHRNRQKQLWSDRKLIVVLEKIKAKRLLNGNPVRNLGQLTEEMVQCPSFEKLEQELLKGFGKTYNFDIKIKLDKKRL